MSIEEVTLKQLKTHIKRRYNKGQSYNLLGFLENKDLDPEVEALFIYRSYQYGARYYDWVNGNSEMKELIAQIEAECDEAKTGL